MTARSKSKALIIKKNIMIKDIFDDKNFGADAEMSSNTIDWGKVGDSIVGTFVRARHGVETQYGENSIYELLAEKGSFHKITNKVPADKPTVINKGESWSVWGRGDIFDGQMNSLRPGQVVKLTFTESMKSKMGNDAKIIKIFAPKNNDGTVVMNQEWLDTQSVTGGDL